MTHSYLLKGEEQPECIPCNEALTVKHILIDCKDYDHIRNKYFTTTCMKDLLNNVDSKEILGFIAEIGFLNKI